MPGSFLDMVEFALTPELDDLEAVAERLGRERLAPDVRDHEAAGRWPEQVMEVLDQLPLGALDLPPSLGGAELGSLAKSIVLETLARADAGGLPAADRYVGAIGALAVCPDEAVVGEIVAACDDGSARCALTVAEPDVERTRLAWAPGWPDLRWVWVSDDDTLRLLQVDGTAEPTLALAFQASGGVSVDLAPLETVGRWELGAEQALAVRARARLWAAAVAVGVAQAAIEDTIEYTTQRVVFGKPVAHHQGNAFDLAAAAAGVHAARLLVRDAAASVDRNGSDAGYWATQAWIETMEAAFVATNVGIQLLGGHGFIVDHLAEKRFREARHLALLFGGRDAAELDVADHTLDVRDPLVTREAR
ncbi:MAG: acyl-CoA dehydrogenase family protein [Acidimicrobiales bacterium]